jgi:hypothetical protein
MKFTQAHVASTLKFFKNNFLSKYNLEEYHDVNAPAIFFGLRDSTELIKRHRGYKLLIPCTPIDYPRVAADSRSFFMCDDNYTLPEGIIRKSLTPEIKDYSFFKPSVMGDKIYSYSGFKNGWSHGLSFVREIQKNIDFEIITTAHLNLKDYYDIEYLKSNFYDKCFLNLNLTKGNALSTTIEMGLMGRKTIFKDITQNSIQRIGFPNFIYYENMEDIVRIINEESKKIGTIQPSIDAHNIGDEWLDLDFWL